MKIWIARPAILSAVLTRQAADTTTLLYGYSHVRYDHKSRPRVLHLVCAKCGNRAEAAKDSERDKGDVIGDTAGTWHLADWAIVCQACPCRQASVAYEDLSDPFYRVEARGSELWAWNRDHFRMLLRLLNHESVSGDPYAWFATYAHSQWLRETNRHAFVKQMRRFLAEHDE